MVDLYSGTSELPTELVDILWVSVVMRSDGKPGGGVAVSDSSRGKVEYGGRVRSDMSDEDCRGSKEGSWVCSRERGFDVDMLGMVRLNGLVRVVLVFGIVGQEIQSTKSACAEALMSNVR